MCIRDRHCGVAETDGAHHVHHVIPLRKFASQEEGNRPENLVTLCSRCHRLAEQNVQIQSGISTLGYLLANLAPFFVMCDRKDLDFFAEDRSPLAGNDPAVLIYDNIAGGIGLSRKLFDLHHKIIAAALDLVSKCPCEMGCPSCVGPVAENGEGAKTLVTSCAMCYQTYAVLYERFGLKRDLKVVHSSQLIAELIGKGKLKPKSKVDLNVTYHDPCHLGRLGEPWIHWQGTKIPGDRFVFDPPRPYRRGTNGVYEPPREVLAGLPGVRDFHDVSAVAR